MFLFDDPIWTTTKIKLYVDRVPKVALTTIYVPEVKNLELNYKYFEWRQNYNVSLVLNFLSEELDFKE